VFTYTLTSFLSAFDRLHFYYYHKQNLSSSAETLLSNVDSFIADKGSLLQNLLDNCNSSVSLCQNINGLYSGLQSSLDFKYRYSEASFLAKNPNGIGFFAINLDFFFYELPGILAVYLLMALLFRATFRSSISKHLRKYSLWGIALALVFEGNFEQFAFYFFAECRTLFSASLAHRLANVFLLYFFFAMLVFAVGGLVWFRFWYRKLLKYFLEDSRKRRLAAVAFESLERAVFPLLFGAAHALLLDNLLVQTAVLASVETAYFGLKLVNLRSSVARHRFKVVMLAVTSLLRMAFILTFYLFETQGQPAVINLVHYQLVWLYLICWVTETVFECGVFAKEAFRAIRGICKTPTKNKLPKSNKLNRKRKILRNKDQSSKVCNIVTSNFKSTVCISS
jgi:hypothetical protein